MPRALISGGSIAGPMLAFWLARHGWSTTVVERVPGDRDTGQNVDVRGAAREVLRRMDLEEPVRAVRTGEQGLSFVDGAGRAVARFPSGDAGSDGVSAELEILRGELSRLIVERTTGSTEYRYGQQITAVDEHDDGVDVTLTGSGPERFDVLVVAEGLGSHTRRRFFPDARVRDLGVSMAYLTIPRAQSDDGWWRWYNAPGGRAATVRPDNVGTTRATLSVVSPVRGLDDLDAADQARVLRETFADAGWEVPRILEGLGPDGDPSPFYFQRLGQVRMPSWHAGRIVVVGDAAYCPSPMSGMGTTCAIVGAYVLAGELGTRTDHREAFAAYESRVRPFVERAQQLPPGTPWIAHPRSSAGIRVFRTLAGLAGSAPVQAVLGLVGGGVEAPAGGIELPRYAEPAAA